MKTMNNISSLIMYSWRKLRYMADLTGSNHPLTSWDYEVHVLVAMCQLALYDYHYPSFAK